MLCQAVFDESFIHIVHQLINLHVLLAVPVEQLNVCQWYHDYGCMAASVNWSEFIFGMLHKCICYHINA